MNNQLELGEVVTSRFGGPLGPYRVVTQTANGIKLAQPFTVRDGWKPGMAIGGGRYVVGERGEIRRITPKPNFRQIRALRRALAKHRPYLSHNMHALLKAARSARKGVVK